MVPSRGFITPIGDERDERFAVHADGRLLARHGCKVMAALHLVDLDLQQGSDDETQPWSPSATEEVLGGCSGYGYSPPVCEICEQPVLDPDDPMDFGVCRACWREHDDLIREEAK